MEVALPGGPCRSIAPASGDGRFDMTRVPRRTGDAANTESIMRMGVWAGEGEGK